MNKRICNKTYDTDTASLVKKHTYSYFGDPAGYEETLYRTPEGLFFLYVCGGESSPYPTENIKRMGKEKAAAWLEQH